MMFYQRFLSEQPSFLSISWFGEYTDFVQLHSSIAAVAVIDPHEQLHVIGSRAGSFGWASITKILTSYVFADAVAGGFITFDQLTSDGIITFADLLSHASGVRGNGEDDIAPRTKRIYTNEAYVRAEKELVLALGSDFDGTTVASLFNDGVKQQLECGISFSGSCASSAEGSFDDLIILLKEMRTPNVVEPSVHELLTTPYLPNLAGIVPGWGHFTHNVWGIGYEIHAEKKDHWMGSLLSPQSYGHFGMSGSFVVHDPINNISIACTSNKDFGPWAKQVWPSMVDELFNGYAQ